MTGGDTAENKCVLPVGTGVGDCSFEAGSQECSIQQECSSTGAGCKASNIYFLKYVSQSSLICSDGYKDPKRSSLDPLGQQIVSRETTRGSFCRTNDGIFESKTGNFCQGTYIYEKTTTIHNKNITPPTCCRFTLDPLRPLFSRLFLIASVSACFVLLALPCTAIYIPLNKAHVFRF